MSSSRPLCREESLTFLARAAGGYAHARLDLASRAGTSGRTCCRGLGCRRIWTHAGQKSRAARGAAPREQSA
eukprot:3223360-Prymnesium_polylepis.1